MYITVDQKPAFVYALTIDDIINGTFEDANLDREPSYGGTVTRRYDHVPQDLMDKTDVDALIHDLETFVQLYEGLYKVNRRSLYNSWEVPKRTGGRRKIDAPKPELMQALTHLRSIFEIKFSASHHTSAFAYVKQRSNKDALRKHQSNESNWFLKTDFSNFFGSITFEFVMSMLEMIFPFNLVCISPKGRAVLEEAIDLCFLDGYLPQGTPISPMLTNLIMIPIDHKLFGLFAKGHMAYTRYADDMLISCPYPFNYKETVGLIRAVLAEFKAPVTIKDEKTRYGPKAGSNWNLGLMLNKDNEITVGHEKKKFFKAALCNFVLDFKNGKPWKSDEARNLAGKLSYYRSIEKDYFDSIIRKINIKFHVDAEAMLKACVSGKYD